MDTQIEVNAAFTVGDILTVVVWYLVISLIVSLTLNAIHSHRIYDSGLEQKAQRRKDRWHHVRKAVLLSPIAPVLVVLFIIDEVTASRRRARRERRVAEQEHKDELQRAGWRDYTLENVTPVRVSHYVVDRALVRQDLRHVQSETAVLLDLRSTHFIGSSAADEFGKVFNKHNVESVLVYGGGERIYEFLQRGVERYHIPIEFIPYDVHDPMPVQHNH